MTISRHAFRGEIDIPRFKKHGANCAIVETYLDSAPARRAYEVVGFQQTHTIRRKGKRLKPSW